jgi:fructose-1,6-bisphosphatase/inositol monophosphatase family enzyme
MWSSPDGWIPEKMRGITEGTHPDPEQQDAVAIELSGPSPLRSRACRRPCPEQRAASHERLVLKGRHDFVTEVDRTAERLIGEILTSGDGGGRIVGEELSP